MEGVTRLWRGVARLWRGTMERDYGGEWPDYGEGLWRGVTRLWGDPGVPFRSRGTVRPSALYPWSSRDVFVDVCLWAGLVVLGVQ